MAASALSRGNRIRLMIPLPPVLSFLPPAGSRGGTPILPARCALEFVLVVPRDDVFEGFYPHGFTLEGEMDMKALLSRAREKAFFVERRKAEVDPGLKQLIPYCLVLHPPTRGLFVMKRLPAQGEARLHGKLSIGVGGHINPIDQEGGKDPVQGGLRRELSEEVVISGEERVEFLGILNDDSNPVGAVHLGLVHALVLRPEGSVRVRETHAIEGELKPLEVVREMWQNPGGFESWSEAVLERSSTWCDRLF